MNWTRVVQVKLWDPLRTRAIPERLRGVYTTRRYTNPRLPLPLPPPPRKSRVTQRLSIFLSVFLSFWLSVSIYLYVCLSVCLLATSRISFWSDLHANCARDVAVDKEKNWLHFASHPLPDPRIQEFLEWFFNISRSNNYWLISLKIIITS